MFFLQTVRTIFYKLWQKKNRLWIELSALESTQKFISLLSLTSFFSCLRKKKYREGWLIFKWLVICGSCHKLILYPGNTIKAIPNNHVSDGKKALKQICMRHWNLKLRISQPLIAIRKLDVRNMQKKLVVKTWYFWCFELIKSNNIEITNELNKGY